MKKIINIICCFLTSFTFNSCTSNTLSSEEMREQILKGLSQRYPEDEFEVMNVWNATAPGDKIRRYTSKVNSKKFKRKGFYLHLKRVEDSIIITEDTYALLLLSEVYLDNLNANLEQTKNVFYDVVLGDLNGEQPYLKNKSEAEQYYKQNDSIQWFNLIGIYTDNYDDKEALENTVTALANDFNEIYPSSHSFEVYFYPMELKESNLQFLSDEDMMDKAPEKDIYFAYWRFYWRKYQLEEEKGNIASFIKNRREVVNWRRGEYNK